MKEIEINPVEECALNAVWALAQFGNPRTRLEIGRFVRMMTGEMPFQLIGPPLTEADMKPEVAAAIASLLEKLCLYYVEEEDSYEITGKGVTALEKAREKWEKLLTPELLRELAAGMYRTSKCQSFTESTPKEESVTEFFSEHPATKAVEFILENLPGETKKLDSYQREILKSPKRLDSYSKKRRK